MQEIFRQYYQHTEASLQQALVAMKDRGCTQLLAVKILKEELNLSLRDADEIVLNSWAWLDSREATQQLRHEFGQTLSITSFWEWFASIEKELQNNLQNDDLLSQLDEKITALGDFSWELGPGDEAAFRLIISPNGDPQLLHQTKDIISLAPILPDWDLYYAKQPRDWQPGFILYINGEQVAIKAGEWKYLLLAYPDNTFDIIIKANNLPPLANDDKYMVAEIALDGIIGEEMRMQVIQEIEMVDEFEPEHGRKASNMRDLLDHLKQYHHL